MFQGCVLELLGRRDGRTDRFAAQMYVQENHMTESQLFPLQKNLMDQIRLSDFIRDDEVRKLLFEDALLKLPETEG